MRIAIICFLIGFAGCALAQSSGNVSTSGNAMSAFGPTIQLSVPGKVRSFATSMFNASDVLDSQVDMAGVQFTDPLVSRAPNRTDLNQTLALPDNTFELPITHADFAWRSSGKDPISKDPVAQISYFFISEAMRGSISGGNTSSSALRDQLPADYVCDNVTVNGVGMSCWASNLISPAPSSGGNSTGDNSTAGNSSSGSNTTEKFEQALGYLVANGQIIGVQHLISKQFLLTHPKEECYPVSMPQKFASAAWFPEQSCVRYWQGVYSAVLQRWSFHEASAGGTNSSSGNSTQA